FLLATLVPQALPVLLRIGEDVVCQVHTRPGRLWMQPTHMLDISSQDSRLQVLGAKQVIGYEQELLILHPGVFDTYSRQLRERAGRAVVLQKQMQHRHEMGFPRTKAAVQIGRLTAVRVKRRADEA